MTQSPIRVLFVCHGNICRSTMAEFVLKDMVARRGLTEQFHIESAATSTEEIGNPVYPPASMVSAASKASAPASCAAPITTPSTSSLAWTRPIFAT